MTNKFDVWFNSGQDVSNHYSDGSNVSLIEITNSDQDYYQSGRLQLFNTPSSQNIGDEVRIDIDGSNQFNGYVSRKQQTIDKGRKVETYQLIGKTYDLWRYVTDANAIYSGMTSYIVSSLVSTYCTEIDTSSIPYNVGTNLVNDIDLTNKIVGDCIVELTELDGYRFYVDNDDKLQYYFPSTREYDFTIEEDDIISMDPIEESDEDIVNDVLVVGGSDYSSKTNVSRNHPVSSLFPSGVLVAQQFTGENNRLSAVQLHLDRSIDPNQPGDLIFEIWKNSEFIILDDDFDNSNKINFDSSYNMTTSDSNLALNKTLEYKVGNQSYSKYSLPLVNSIKYIHVNNIYSGNLSSFNVRVGYDWGVNTYARAALYKESDRSLVAQTGLISGNSTAQWLSKPFGPSGVSKNTEYILALWSDNVIGTKAYFEYGDDFECYYCWNRDFTASGNGDFATYLSPLDPQSNYSLSQLDYPFYFEMIPSSGNYPYSGLTYTESMTEECKYMKIDLTDVVSSNRIYISGTHDGGTTWKTLSDGEYVKFDAVSTLGSQVKFKFSSNGKYTPKIGHALVTISASGGGFDQVVLNENFTDWTHISSESVNNINLSPSWADSLDTNIHANSLMLSGMVLRDVHGSDTNSLYEDSIQENADWVNPTYAFDNDDDTQSTFGYLNGTYADVSGQNMFYDDPHTLVAFKLKKWLKGATDITQGFNIKLSSNNYDWKTMFYKAYHGLDTGWTASHPNGELKDDVYIFDTVGLYTRPYYSGCKGIKIFWNDMTCGIDGIHLYDFGRVVTIPNEGFTDGNCKSERISLGDLTYTELKLDVDEYLSHLITYSGSMDGGSNWQKLNKNQWNTMSNGGNELVLWYNIQASGNYGNKSGQVHYPNIRSVTATISQVNVGGVPLSGSKQEWSDTNMEFKSIDVPYPPSYSSWNTYSDPAFSPNLLNGNKWWMVMEYSDGNTQVMLNDSMSTDHWINDGTYQPANDRYLLDSTRYIQSGGISVDADVNILLLEFEHWLGEVKIYVSGNGRDYTYLRTTEEGPPLDENPELYTYNIPSTYINPGGNIGLRFVGDGSDNAGIGHVKLYKDESFWTYSYDSESTYDGKIAYSWNEGYSWSTNSTCPTLVPDGNMTFKLGWKEGNITYRASNQTSIDTYGRHFKKISDSTITTNERAQARAEYEISGSNNIPKKGTITIDGKTDININYRFSSNLSNFGIDDIWDVRSYTQRIDKNGFTTTINYGRPEFDFIKKISDVEKKQESGE